MDARQLVNVDLARIRLVLLHGEDEGQIRESAQALTRKVAGTLNDPFRVVELMRDGWGHVPAECAALSMMGGRRVIRVRDAAEAVLGQVSQALRGPGDGLMILEAVGLGKGKLRSFAEASQESACVACYPDEGRGLSELIKSGLAERQVRIEPDALTWLGQVLTGDRAVLRGEIEKLALLAGAGGLVDIDTAQACTADGGAGSADEGVLAALAGDLGGADKGVDTAIRDGLAGVAVLRVALSQLLRLHQARLRVESGISAADAMRSMRPPVFYRAQAATTTCLTLWTSDALLRVIEEARQAELACKRTASRPELLARRFVSGLARQASLRRRPT